MKSNLSSDIRITAFLVAIIGLFFATSPLLAADYTYTEIIPPNWVWSSCRAAINDSGVVAGWGHDGTSWKAFTYYQGTYQIITQAGWDAIYPLSMNNNGTIVGEAQPAGSLAFRAVIYSEGVLTDLTPTGVSQARLVDINDNGDMIGNTYGTDPIGFLYSDGVYTQLLPPGWTGSIVNAISNDGTVIGRNLPDDKQFLYKNGTYTIIDSTGEFMGINDNGEVVGIVPMVTGGSYTPKSFIYSNGEFTTGIAPPGWLTAYLLDINNSGVAAGYGWDPVINTETGFTYDHGTYTTLSIPPGMLYMHVTAINENGIILGMGAYPGDIIKVFTATPGVVNSVDPIYAWHTFYGASFSEEARSVVTDGSGNVYITGDSSVTWNGPAGQPPLHAHSGGYDIFVLKLDSSGTYQWHTFYGSSASDWGRGIAVVGSGNVYVTGESGAAWNGPAGESPRHAYTGNMDIFVLKLDSSGVYQWHTFYGSSDAEAPRSITTDGSGNVYIAGFSYAAWNGPTGESPIGAFSAAWEDIFVLKLDSSGAYQWHTFSGAPNGTASAAFGIAPDGSGNIYVTGVSDATWTGPTGQNPLNTYTGGFDVFVLKLDSSGAYQWHTFYGSSASDLGWGIAAVGSGNVYVTGGSYGVWNGPAGESPLDAYIGSEDIFVLKLDSSGAYRWHTFYGSSTYDHGYAITTDGSENVYITGQSYATWNGPAGQSPLHPYSQYYGDTFVLKLAAPAPDLIETAVSDPPLSSTPGSSFSVTDTVKNQGSTSAGASIASYYLSLDTLKGSGDILLTGSRSVPPLGINETNDGIMTVTIPFSTAAGSYFLLACADDANAVVESNENNNCIASVSKVSVTPPVNPTEITLQSPIDGAVFDSCSLIATHQPTFNWTATGTFSGLSIQFSTSPTDFKTFGVLLSKASLRATSVSWTPVFFSWKSILTASYNKGNVRDIYWKLVGTLPDKTTVESEVRSFRIGPPQPVTINAPAEEVTLPFNPPPSFDMNTNCNVKFTLEFSRSDAFSDPKSIKKFVFTLKDPTLQPTLQKALTSAQWTTVKKSLAPGGYFRVKASDAIGRETISGVRSFNVQSMLIGNWDVTGMTTTTVALVGRFPVTQRDAAVDQFTFSEDGTFQMTDMPGTYTEQGATFTVNLSPADLELYFEQGLAPYLGTVDVTVTGVSFKGTENWTAGTIAGTMTMSMGISIPSQGLEGTVKATVTFRGVQSSVQGLSLSTPEASSPSFIRLIGTDINNSWQVPGHRLP